MTVEHVLNVDTVVPERESSNTARARRVRMAMLVHGVSELLSAAFEEFVGIWQRLLMHLNCAV